MNIIILYAHYLRVNFVRPNYSWSYPHWLSSPFYMTLTPSLWTEWSSLSCKCLVSHVEVLLKWQLQTLKLLMSESICADRRITKVIFGINLCTFHSAVPYHPICTSPSAHAVSMAISYKFAWPLTCDCPQPANCGNAGGKINMWHW